MFHRANLNKKSLIGSSEHKQAADSWEAPKATADVQWALLNLMEIHAQLWPYDSAIRVINRVLIRYEWGAGYGSSEKDRCRIVEEFVDKVLCENASRAARGSPPLPFESVKNRWRDAVEREPQSKLSSDNSAGNKSNQRADGGGQQNNRGRGGGNIGGGRGGARQNRAGWQARSAVATFNGHPVCYHFNMKPPVGKTTACTRPAGGVGCDNGRGGQYAHVCNFYNGSGFCLQPHPRHSNH